MICPLFLHIGYPKTGTTSLQSFFSINDALLREHGVVYSHAGRVFNAHYEFAYRMGLIGEVRFDDAPPLELLLTRLREEIAETGAERALLSAETFMIARKPQVVRRALADFDVKIVVYLRRHDHVIASAYAQSERSSLAPPWSPTIQSFALHRLKRGQYSFDYLATLRNWAAVFGMENVIVRPFERGETPTALYDDFLALMGMPPIAGLQFPAARNTGLSFGAIVAIGAVQRSNAPALYKRAIINGLVKTDGVAGESPRPDLLSPNDRLSILAFYQKDYEVIAREFLGRDDGVLFQEKLPQRHAPWQPPPQPSLQQLTNRLMEAAATVALAQGGSPVFGVRQPAPSRKVPGPS